MVAGSLTLALPLIQTSVYLIEHKGFRIGVLAVILASSVGAVMGVRLGRRGTPRPPAAELDSFLPSPVMFLLFQFGSVILLGLLLLNTGRPFGRDALLTAAGGLVLLLAWHRGLTLWIMKFTGLMKPAGAPLTDWVAEQSEALGIPVRQVYEIDMPMCNAFALPWSGELAFTTRIGKVLDPGELKSITSHELGHLVEPDRYRWARLIQAFQFAGLGLLPSLMMSYQFSGMLASFGIYMLLQKVRLKLSRNAAQAADRMVLSGGESEGAIYAGALEKIHKDNLIPAVMGGSETHPDLWSRMAKAGVTPDFPRPHPPIKGLWFTILILSCGLLALLNALL